MEKKNKIILIVSIIIILGSVVACVLKLTKKEEEKPTHVIEGIKLPENKDILEDAKVNELDITDIYLLNREDVSSYKAKVSNNTDKDITVSNLYVVFYEGEDKTEILALSNVIIKANNQTYINITSETDLSKTTKIEYIVK